MGYLTILWSLSCLGLILYDLLIHMRVLYYQEPQHAEDDKALEGVSIIICAHNEAIHLPKLIPILLKQNYPVFEVLLVDDRSTDDSPQIMAQWKAQDTRFRYIRIDQPPEGINPKKFALSQGIEEARYDFLLLTDADCIPASERWIQQMQGQMGEGKKIVLGFSPYFKHKTFLNAFIQYETSLTAFQYSSYTLSGFPYMGVGRNLAYRKSLFKESRGFLHHEHITGGDDDLFVSQVSHSDNYSISLHPNSLTFSYPKESWKTWFRQKIRHISVGMYYPVQYKLLLGAYIMLRSIFWIGYVILRFYADLDNFTLFLDVMFLTRLVIHCAILYRFQRKLEGSLSGLSLVIFDFLYVFYIFIIGLSVLGIKKIKWE